MPAATVAGEERYQVRVGRIRLFDPGQSARYGRTGHQKLLRPAGMRITMDACMGKLSLRFADCSHRMAGVNSDFSIL